jgi:hypothetical protein
MTKTSKATAAPPADATQAPGEERVASAVAEASAEAPAATSEPRQTKIQTVVALLRRPAGARIEDIMSATGWQAHSVRGAMSGAVKKGLGLTISSEKTDGARVYRIADGDVA